MPSTSAVSGRQLSRLNRLLEELSESNAFYRAAWAAAGMEPRPLDSLSELERFPSISRADFCNDQREHPPWGTNLTRPIEDYVQVHHSSGTSGSPLIWLDDAEGWNWLLQNAQRAHELQGMRSGDVVLLCTRFAGSLGPWLLYESAVRLGCKCMVIDPRPQTWQVEWLRHLHVDFVVGRPGELLSLADTLVSTGFQLSSRALRAVIATGGPGNTVEARCDLSRRWEAICLNRYGMTEAGTIAAAGAANANLLYLLNDELIVEVIPGGELVLTTLGRAASPLVRYRTGDRVTLNAGAVTLLGDILRAEK